MMKTCRKSVAMVLLLLIHLLTLQIGDAGRNHTNVLNTKNEPKIILEEVIIAGSGNNTRIIANAVAEDTSKLNDEMLSLLSKRGIRRSGRSKQTSSNTDQGDQDAAQSRAAIVNANEEDDDLEMMSRVIAKYEPQRLTSGKTKRKIVDGSNGTHDVQDKVAGSITDLERAYAEMLRNISRKTSELTMNNADVTLNPYLSQAVKQLKQIYIPEVTIRPATNDGAEKSHSDVDSSFTSPTLKSKKSKRLLKKYLQLNRTAATPRFSSVEESKSDEEIAGNNESSTPAGSFKVSNGKTKPKNGLLSVPTSNIYSDSTERLKSRREWNVQDSLIQAIPTFTSRLNNSNSNNIINVDNLKNFNVPSDANAVQLPPRYNVVPRPFSILQSPNSPVTTNIDASSRKSSSSPVGFGHQRQIARSSANVLPLVLPTDLFNSPPARRYIPIKRANHLNLEGNSATIVSTEASPPTSPVGERTTLANYDALYTAVIGTTRSPLVTINSQQSYGSPNYYAITESPAERTVTRTNFATTYIPSQTSASYSLQRQKDSQAIHKNEFLPRIATYNRPDDEKSSLNENAGIALYNKFASLYSTNVPNVFNAPKVITQDFKQPVQPLQQQVSTLPYATLKPLTPASLKVRPTASKSTPYYDSRLFVSQNVDEKHNKNSEENVKTNKQSRVEDADQTEKEDNDDNDDIGNYKTQVITQDFKQPVQSSQQQVSTLPHAILKPLIPTSLKVRPIASSKSTPYYDSRLFVSQNVDEKHNKNSEENVKTNKQSRVEDVDQTEKEDNNDNEDVGNYKTQVNREAYKTYKTPNKQREKKDRQEEEEDRYPQQSRNYGYQDKQYKHDKNDRNSKNNDRREKYENVRHENNNDEEKVDEIEEEEDVSIGKNKGEANDDHRHQYDKYDEEKVDETEEEEYDSIGKNKGEDNDDYRHQYKYDRDNSDEEQRNKPRYDRKKYSKPKDRRDKLDYGSDVERRFGSNNKYFESLYNDDKTRERDKEYRDRSDKKKLVGDNKYKKDQQDRRYKGSEHESVAEDKSFAQPSKDQRAYRQDERYEEEQNNDDDKRKYHQTSPRRDSLREEHTREEYGETNPTHTREEYQHPRVNDDHRDHRRHDSRDQDDGKEKARDHVHGETQEHAHKHEEHHEKKKDGGDHKFEEGGGAEHEKEHHGHEGEKGEKGYKVWHEHEKAEKGHHDKEHANKHYDEKGGEEKKHDEEGGYHEEHHHGEGGKKTAEFGEKGEHKKGHSTHGEHSVHKKDEFEKKTEFFDEFHEDGGVEKHGEHHHDHESKKGGHEKKGHHDGADHEEKYGKEEKHEKGGHHHEHKGHKVDEGHDHHYDHDQKHGKKEGHEHGKKWSFKKGDGGGDHKHNR